MATPSAWDGIAFVVESTVTKSDSRLSVQERIDRFTDRSGGPDACWPWTGGATKGGYGIIGVEGKTNVVTRLIWAQLYGPVPAGYDVCHDCDNSNCVNPAHLWLGTPAENTADMMRKGRGRHGTLTPLKGEMNPRAKLTDQQVVEMRRLRLEGLPHEELAKQFSCTVATVYVICSNRRWRHLPGIDPDTAAAAARERRKAVSDFPNGKLTPDAVRSIKADRESTLRALAKQHGVSAQTILNVRQGKTWSHIQEDA